MRAQLLPLTALIASTLLLVGGNAFLMTLLGVRLSIERFEPAVIGWVLVCYSVGFVIGTLYANRVIARVGHIRAFAAFAAAAAAVALLVMMLMRRRPQRAQRDAEHVAHVAAA